MKKKKILIVCLSIFCILCISFGVVFTYQAVQIKKQHPDFGVVTVIVTTALRFPIHTVLKIVEIKDDVMTKRCPYDVEQIEGKTIQEIEEQYGSFHFVLFVRESVLSFENPLYYGYEYAKGYGISLYFSEDGRAEVYEVGRMDFDYYLNMEYSDWKETYAHKEIS